MISGTTSHKLDLISGYDKNLPIKLGPINGNVVTNIEYTDLANTAYTKIYYTIGDINYVTTYVTPTSQFDTNAHPTIFTTNLSGDDFNNYTNSSGNIQYTFDIKEESKMGLVFPPKVKNELFIERMSVAVFERHSRLANIKSLDDLVEYRNGYYNIVENS
jgi:hypothetical protein